MTQGQYLQRLIQTNMLREPLLRRVIQALDFPEWSSGLDAGCGGELQAVLLAEYYGFSTHTVFQGAAPA